jgi:flagellar L-ring protein precursor FlgH
MKAIYMLVYMIAIGLAVLNSGCATMKSLLGMEDKTQVTHSGGQITTPRFSESPNVLVPANRQYRRMTRSKLEEESDLGPQAGSMWVNEGQGAYLFAQNKSRKEGDLLNVKIDGTAQKQVETKVSVIKKLLKQLEEQEQQAIAPEPPKLADGKTEARAPAAVEKKPEEKEEPLNLDTVPTRIVERLADGNYRIRGQQPFMIGKREYKVIVTGLIRPEDFNDEGVSSAKLLDPLYDVVSLRKKTSEVN